MIVGISRNQYDAELNNSDDPKKAFEDTRIFYLNPAQHGGSYKRPPMYVKPLKNRGWMGFMDAIMPPPGTPSDVNDDLVSFGSIKKRIDDSYSRIPEDQRLKPDSECGAPQPYNRILDRPSKAGIEAVITAALQIYTSAHFVKGMPMFTFVKPSFPDNFSKIYGSYIVETLESSLKDAQTPIKELFNSFKDNEFWYAFLEQSVQLYGRLVDDGAILNVPSHIQDALTNLNNMQEVYEYPTQKDLFEAIKLGDEPFWRINDLTGFISEKNFEGVQASEEDAKLILAELMTRELNLVSERMNKNLESIDMTPKYEKISHWFLENFVGGAAGLNLKGPFTEKAIDLEADDPNSAPPYYTNGGELYIADALDTGSPYGLGDDYKGYYYVNTGESGNTIYVAGKEPIEADHNILEPYENQILVYGTDGDGLGEVGDMGASAATSEKPFVIEQYVSINGAKWTPAGAAAQLNNQPDALGTNISEVYPGTLEQVLDGDGRVVGLKGELGVRNGLRLSWKGHTLASTEIDVLDVSLASFKAAQGSTRLLLCLINNLLEDEKFKLVTEYIFPLNKYTAFMAIYSDLALLPSIGENIFTLGDKITESTATGLLESLTLFKNKPGVYLDTGDFASNLVSTFVPGVPLKLPNPFNFKGGATDEGVPNYGGNEGWEDYNVRKVLKQASWDQWDQILLRNSKQRIKQLFKNYYYSRDFKPGDSLYEERPSKERARRLQAKYKPPAGRELLSWSKKRKLRPNPFGKK